MIVMGLDPASGFGWSAYDTSKPPSAIESDSLKLPAGNDVAPFDKLFHLRRELVPLLRKYQPVFVGIESPFMFAPRYQKKPRRDMLTGIVETVEEGETVINPKTISVAGQVCGAATALCLAWNIQCCHVQPRQWQSGVIPKSVYAQFPGSGKENAKKRAAATCNLLRIASPNQDSRDAALIALWCAGHAQQFKWFSSQSGKVEPLFQAGAA